VITVDIKNKRAENLPSITAEKVDFLIGSSTDPGIVAGITERVRGKKVVVILDSAHDKDHVLAELRAYAPMVPEGSYVIVQDSNVNGHPVLPDYGPGPFEAIEEFLAESDEFQVDKTRERLILTLHPNGYLRRVRPPREARLPAGPPGVSDYD
jgi:cephalosporin hydroxylase